MRLSSRSSLSLGACLFVMACSSSGDEGGGAVTLTGTLLDDFTGLAVASAVLTAENTNPPLTATTTANGEFAFTVDPNTELDIVAAGPAGYRPTRNRPVTVGAVSGVADLGIVAAADALRQYGTLGLIPGVGVGVVFATMVDVTGQPLEGIPLADVQLVDSGGNPVALGPYYFGAAGDLVANATLNVSTAFGGRARVGFLDVPAGPHTLKITFPGPGGPQTKTVEVVTSADGVTVSRL